MFDMHYDLLTLILMANRTKKDISHFLTPLNKENVKGVAANLYFMSRDEMKRELEYPSRINVLKMFKTAKKVLEGYQLDCEFIYSIEGCDYIRDTKELERLSQAGLDSILLTWNNPNKYGSGNITNQGLTYEGRHFIHRAMELGLGIDLSHANLQTYNDIINMIRHSQKPVTCYASHSNLRLLRHHPRNLDDTQIKELINVGGKLGLVAYPRFLTLEKDITLLRKAYAKHIVCAVNMFGQDNIMISSDNMDFTKIFTSEDDSDPAFYPYETMNELIRQDISSYLSEDAIEQIMYGNAHQIYKQLKKKK